MHCWHPKSSPSRSRSVRPSPPSPTMALTADSAQSALMHPGTCTWPLTPSSALSVAGHWAYRACPERLIKVVHYAPAARRCLSMHAIRSMFPLLPLVVCCEMAASRVRPGVPRRLKTKPSDDGRARCLGLCTAPGGGRDVRILWGRSQSGVGRWPRPLGQCSIRMHLFTHVSCCHNTLLPVSASVA
jgi:hypothetical protein